MTYQKEGLEKRKKDQAGVMWVVGGHDGALVLAGNCRPVDKHSLEIRGKESAK